MDWQITPPNEPLSELVVLNKAPLITPYNKLPLSHLDSGDFSPVNKPISLTGSSRGHIPVYCPMKSREAALAKATVIGTLAKVLALHGSECWC